MNLPPAETLQAEPANTRTDFWLGFTAASFVWGFWVAVYAGLETAGVL